MIPQQAATLSPRQLLTTPGFWRTNRGLLGATAIGIALILLLFNLTYPRAGSFKSLVILIYLIAAWGLFLAVRAAARVAVDDAIARRVEERATNKLGQLKGGTLRRIELERIETLIPHNPHWNQGMIQLFRLVIEEARDRKFPAPALLTQPLRDRSIGDLFHLQTLQRTALQLGILGTFIGLLGAIFKLRGAVDAGQIVDTLFADLHLSFSTSIAGLVVSVLLGLVLMALRQQLESFFGHMETSLQSFITLARRCEITDEYLAEFSQIRDALGQARDSIQGHAAEMRLQTLEIKSGLVELGKLRLRFNEFLEDIRGEQAHVLSEFKSVYELVSPQRTAEELERSLARSIERVSESFDSRLEAGFAELNRYDESLKSFRTVFGEMPQKTAEAFEQRLIRSLGQVAESFSDRLQTELTELQRYIESLETFRGVLRDMRSHAEQAQQESATSRKTFDEAHQLVGTRMKELATVHDRLLERVEMLTELDIEGSFGNLQRLVDDAGHSLDERLIPHLTRVQRQLKEQHCALQSANALMEKLVDQQNFFHTAIVRPWRWLRLRFGS